MATALSKATDERLQLLFAPEDQPEARNLLVHECGENLPFCEGATPSSSERIRFAVLKLSDGRLRELRRAIELARTDWRDALVAAGFGDDTTAHSKWWP